MLSPDLQLSDILSSSENSNQSNGQSSKINEQINPRCNQSEESNDYCIIRNYYQSVSSKESDDKTQDEYSVAFMDSSNFNLIASCQESDCDIKENDSITEYLQVTPDGFEQTIVLKITSVDFDKRIEYVNDLIKKINAGDKYTCLL